VAVVGDSFTEGQGVNEPDTYARRLEDGLNAAEPGYPITSYFGDLGHPRAANRPEEVDYVLGLIRPWLAAYLKGGTAPALSGVKQVAVAAPSGAPKPPAAPPLMQSAAPKTAAQGVRFHNLTVDPVDLDGKPGVMRMGLVKKLEGDPDDPISQGKLCARGQAALQVTYHPDRLDKPRKRKGERGSGEFTEITWDEAIKELTAKLNEARDVLS